MAFKNYIESNFDHPADIFRAVSNLLKVMAKEHTGISDYENDINAYVDSYMMGKNDETIADLIGKLMEDFICNEEMDNHSGKTLFIYRTFASPDVPDNLLFTEKYEHLRSAINVANQWEKREHQHCRLRFYIIDHDADTELYDGEIREMFYEYQLIHKVFNQEGEIESDERGYYDTIDEAKKALDLWLNESPFDGMTNEIERCMDIRSYQNVEFGIRYELMDATAHEFLVATRD